MKNILFLFLLATFLTACANKEQPDNTATKETGVTNPIAPLNPNGDSELALLMRKMEKQWQDTKKNLEAGQTIHDVPDFHDLLSATPTDESMTMDGFKGYATSYLNKIKALQNTKGSQQKTAYNNVINGCILCHENSCSGPIPRIKKLLIKE